MKKHLDKNKPTPENNITATGVFHVPFHYDGFSLTLKLSAHQLKEVLLAYEAEDKKAACEAAEAVFKPKKTEK